ncbi:PREDICTED: uncharacterized protein LOC105570876 [Vollenhovia emeryi]|uniref:uncharacterized protein LOC105570876 n=1 Tax=Vollenhovia emeryi TaxID=411798 RepID=UPI0005F4D961|nr:PREDICTED: uncharacterized protein LOC105570876 [Vollenhovia emeryi]
MQWPTLWYNRRETHTHKKKKPFSFALFDPFLFTITGYRRHNSRGSSSPDRSRSRSRRRDYYDCDRYKGPHTYQYGDNHDQEDRDKDGHYSDNSCSPESLSQDTQPEVQTVTETSGDKENIPANTLDIGEKLAGGTKPPAEVISEEVQEVELEADVLEIIGERFKPDRVLAPAIHSQLVEIWGEIIEKGLPTEERKASLKKFPPPKNCVLMDPPKLNLEVKAVLDSTIQKRDERIVEKQEKIAASLAGVGKIIELLLKSNPANKKEYLEPLIGVARLLADLQHDETSIRRSLILKNIKAPFKDTLKDLLPDEWLFGKDLSEKIKAAKVLQQSTKDLKLSFKRSTDQGKNSKNSKGPPHQGQYKSNTYPKGGGYRQNYSRRNTCSRSNKSTPRGKSHYQKQEQTDAKKSN